MQVRWWHLLVALGWLLSAEKSALIGDAQAILQKNCFGCHNSKVKLSGLDLSSKSGFDLGGSRGGPASAHILDAISRTGKIPAMPPTRALAEGELATLKSWIQANADYPGNVKAQVPEWWSFKKPIATAIPEGAHPVDYFIRSKLQTQQLKSAPQASRATLIRRLYFDLTGLPPSSDEVAAFVAAKDPGAYEALVDKLLASPHYGERWGRHWLDLVRYSDTAGFELDSYIADAYRFRDYVIRSFNEDKPYDRFVKEQLAADEFFPEDTPSLIGTGYYCVGPNRDLFPDQADIARVEMLTDYTDTTSGVFLGLTAGCARCHDHKFDPISQKDYFRVQAAFAPLIRVKVPMDRLPSLFWDVAENTREMKLREVFDQANRMQSPCRKQLREAKLATLPAAIQQALETDDNHRTPAMKELASEHSNKLNVTDDEVRACLSATDQQVLTALERRVFKMMSTFGTPKPFACGARDIGDYGPTTYLPTKGSSRGTPVEPGFFSVLGGFDAPPPIGPREATGPIPLEPTTGRRMALANWITSKENPLTARVMVNRIWQFHFGRGIVNTPSDFGTRGSAPTHPELLDYLALRFVADGWSFKKMHKLILTSETFQQDSVASSEANAKDPENKLLSHFSRRRLAAEEIRDSVLAATGSLNTKMYGRPVVPPLSKEELFNLIGRPDDAWIVTTNETEHTRRSIYLIQKRAFRMPMMEVFDAPESMVTCSRRDSSTTAPQSLTLLNGSFTLQRASAFASQLGEQPIQEAWKKILLRDPTAAEQKAAQNFLEVQTNATKDKGKAKAELVRALLNTNEFLYVE
jgi:hypothetical protein